MASCLYCGSTERNFASKFCTDCGNNWPANQSVDKPADVLRYVDSLYRLAQSSDFEVSAEKTIKKMRESFKISHSTHERVMEDLRQRLVVIEGMQTFQLEFNQNDSDAYAEQDTLLQFRLVNDPNGEQLQSVELTWNDPDPASGRAFRASNAVPVQPGGVASLQGGYVFMRFGPKSIDRMQLRVELPWGDVGHFVVEPIVINVRNSDQKINKNITNNISMERGVLDNSNHLADADGAPLTVGRQAIWKKVSLTPMVQRPDAIDDLIASPPASAATAAVATTAPPAQSPAVVAAPEPEPTPEPKPQAAPEVVVQAQSMPHVETKVVVTGQGGESLEVLTQSTVIQAAPADAVIESDDPRECATQVFKRLAWFAEASPVTKAHTAIPSDRFDLDFIEAVYHSVPDANEDDVLGMVFVDPDSVAFDQHDCVVEFDGLACVFSVSGVTQVSFEDGTVNAESFHSWGDMAAMGWDFYRRRFGDDKFVVAFGDGSVSQNLPGCKFDLRQYKGAVPVTQVFEEANAWLQRLYERSPTSELDEDDETAEEGTDAGETEPAWPFEAHGSSDPAQTAAATPLSDEEPEEDEALFDEDEEDDEDEARQQTLDEIGSRMQRFFGKFDFALQRCDEHQARCVFTRDRVDDELLQALHDSVYNTGSGMRVVCVEPGCALLDASGMLLGFKGSASALSAEGIFHLVANPSGGYMMDGTNSFLGWQRFFDELHGDLIVRDEGPDLWLGNPMNYLIRGCYVDYSVQVIQWDYFENYVHKDLMSDLALFKESVDWL